MMDFRASILRFLERAREFVRRKDGVAAIEMAIVTPVLLILFCGGSEIAFFARAHFRVAQMASTVADAVARYQALTSSDVASIFSVSSEVMGDDEFASKGYVILSSVKRAGGKSPTVAWQCKGGVLQSASRVGALSKTATLPNNLTLANDDNVIVAEVFFQYTPIFDKVISVNQLLYKTAVFRPRLGDLTTAPGC